MDILTDEHEREEVVKKWWHEHWKPIILGIVITLLGLLGIRQYQAYRLEQHQATAFEVYQLQSQLNTRGVAAIEGAAAFLKEHDDIFGAILALDLARVQIGAGNYEAAAKYVEFAKQNGGDLISPQASLVLARVQCQNKQYDAALATIEALKSDAYKADAAEVKGDILAAKGDLKGAHDAYADAIKYTQEAKLQISAILQMKFDNLITAGDTPAYKLVEEQNSKMLLQNAPAVSE